MRSADEVHALSLAKLDDEYCAVVMTGAVLRLEAVPERR